jgi:hypothetical protein
MTENYYSPIPLYIEYIFDINDIKALYGDFIWFWDHRFFIITDNGNFIWSCPDYLNGNSFLNGNN